MILIYTAIMWSVIIFAPEFLIGIFSSDKELLVDAVEALKLYFAAFIDKFYRLFSGNLIDVTFWSFT